MKTRFFVSTAFFAVLAGFIWFFNAPNVFAQEVPGNHVVYGNEEWGNDGTVLIEPNESMCVIIIMPNVTLSIKPGTVVKFKSGCSMRVYGNLQAIGTPEKPIVFTSFYDDTVGGDSDASNGVPWRGDWDGINMRKFSGYPDPTISFDYVDLKYGGGYRYGNWYGGGMRFLSIENGNLSINHSNVINNNSGIAFYGPGNYKIENSNIFGNFYSGNCKNGAKGGFLCNELGMEALNVDVLGDAKNNYWGCEAGPIDANIINLNEIDPNNLTLAGCAAIKGNIEYRPFLTSKWPVIEKDPVILIPGILGSWQVDGEWKIDPILHTYDNLIDAMKLAGYEEGKNLFLFPYNWYQDNSLTAFELSKKVKEIKDLTGSNKIDIVAHSMGGLVARAYVEGDYYTNDVDQLVFLGTPHRGAPLAYLRWEAGEGFLGATGKAIKLLFSQEAHHMGYNTLFDYLRSRATSISQLLPDYAYLKDDNQVSLRTYDNINYPDNYPYNNFLINLNSEEKMRAFNNLGLDILNITGDTGNDTIGAITVVPRDESDAPLWEHGKEKEFVKLFGDGTVPGMSSSLLASTQVVGDHESLPTVAQKEVINFLTGQMPESVIENHKASNKFILIRMFSPVDFVVVAPDGSRIGKDFETGQVINEIEGAFYSGFNTDNEFVLIPDPVLGDYNIEVQGTDNGEYTASANYIDDNQDVEKNFTGNITTGEEKSFNIEYGGEDGVLSELKPEDDEILDKDISAVIKRINDLKADGSITKKSSAKILISRLKLLNKRLNKIDAEKRKIEKLIQELNTSKIKDKKKDNKIKDYQKQLEKLESTRQKLIKNNLDTFLKILDKIKNKNIINQKGYDILKKDVNYLKINL